jgi:5-(carboxyamino)imidazole ribonucleotide mutase
MRLYPRFPTHHKGGDKMSDNAKIGIIMGSQSDWPTMRPAAEILEELGIAHEVKIVSAHRTPTRMYDYAKAAQGRGLKAIIAGAGGAAHLPGMTAALTIVQMPAGVPVGTLAIGEAGAKNAALLAAAIIANEDADLAKRLQAWRDARTADVAEAPKEVEGDA